MLRSHEIKCALGPLALAIPALAVLVAASAPAGAADKVTFVTDYGLYGRHAYYFVAIEKGFYARENLEV